MKKLLIWVILAIMLNVQAFAACNINTASAEELCELKGIGKGTAEKIIQYRETTKFTNIKELMKVKGIGQKKYDSIKSELSV